MPRTDYRCPLQSLAPAAVSPDAVTDVTLLIVAALPTPELRAGAFLAVLTHTVTAQCMAPQSRPGSEQAMRHRRALEHMQLQTSVQI